MSQPRLEGAKKSGDASLKASETKCQFLKSISDDQTSGNQSRNWLFEKAPKLSRFLKCCSRVAIVICAIIGSAIVAEWIRSYSVEDRFVYITASADKKEYKCVEIFLIGGWFHAKFQSSNYSSEEGGNTFGTGWGLHPTPPLGFSHYAKSSEGLRPEVDDDNGSQSSTFQHSESHTKQAVNEYQPFRSLGTADNQFSHWFIRFWLVALLFFTPLIIWCVIALDRVIKHRRPPGACTNCGYDLRATPDRCPECGYGKEKRVS